MSAQWGRAWARETDFWALRSCSRLCSAAASLVFLPGLKMRKMGLGGDMAVDGEWNASGTRVGCEQARVSTKSCGAAPDRSCLSGSYSLVLWQLGMVKP